MWSNWAGPRAEATDSLKRKMLVEQGKGFTEEKRTTKKMGRGRVVVVGVSVKRKRDLVEKHFWHGPHMKDKKSVWMEQRFRDLFPPSPPWVRRCSRGAFQPPGGRQGVKTQLVGGSLLFRQCALEITSHVSYEKQRFHANRFRSAFL